MTATRLDARRWEAVEDALRADAFTLADVDSDEAREALAHLAAVAVYARARAAGPAWRAADVLALDQSEEPA